MFVRFYYNNILNLLPVPSLACNYICKALYVGIAIGVSPVSTKLANTRQNLFEL